MIVRRATIDDAAAIAAVWVEGWRTAYRGLVPDVILDGLSTTAKAEQWRKRLATEDATLVADVDGEVAGYCRLGHGEVASLYVRTRGRGVGAGLLTAALAELGEPVALWVFARNTRARAFYERFGFRPDGAQQIDPGTGAPEIRMVRP